MIILFMSPMIILFTGIILLLVKKSYNPIFLGIIGLFVLEVLTYLRVGVTGSDSSWVLYFSGPLYFILIQGLYSRLFFSLFTKVIFRLILAVVLSAMFIGLFFIYTRNVNLVFHYIAVVELIVLMYPVVYFFKLATQTIKYELKYFILNSIILLFFSLEIVLYVMLKFLLDYNLFESIHIAYFRFLIIQLFYISLIYFGCKLGKT